MSYFYIYKMTHPETGEFYIGRRLSDKSAIEDIKYRGSSATWYRSLSKDVIQNILIKEILDSDIESIEHLNEREIQLISENIKNPLCKNAHIPGKGFYTIGPLSDETKHKISKSLEKTKEYRSDLRKGIVFTEEHKQKLRDARKNQVISDEHKLKISESLKGKKPTDEHKKKISESKKGMIFTEEHKQKLSNSNKGRIFTEEHKQKLRESRKKRIFSEDTKRKISESKKGTKYKKSNEDDIEIKSTDIF